MAGLGKERVRFAVHATHSKTDHPDGPGARAFYSLFSSSKVAGRLGLTFFCGLRMWRSMVARSQTCTWAGAAWRSTTRLSNTGLVLAQGFATTCSRGKSLGIFAGTPSLQSQWPSPWSRNSRRHQQHPPSARQLLEQPLSWNDPPVVSLDTRDCRQSTPDLEIIGRSGRS